MSIRQRTNPDVAVSGRNRETLYAQQTLLVRDRFSGAVEILEVVAFFLSRVTRLLVADVTQARIFRGFLRISYDFKVADFFSFFGENLRTDRHATSIRAGMETRL